MRDEEPFIREIVREIAAAADRAAVALGIPGGWEGIHQWLEETDPAAAKAFIVDLDSFRKLRGDKDK
jgi:hypothetical protein